MGCPEGRVAVDDGRGYLLGLVGGVVEDLDFQLFAGIIHGADGFDEAVDHELLIEDGELDGDPGKLDRSGDGGSGLWRLRNLK